MNARRWALVGVGLLVAYRSLFVPWGGEHRAAAMYNGEGCFSYSIGAGHRRDVTWEAHQEWFTVSDADALLGDPFAATKCLRHEELCIHYTIQQYGREADGVWRVELAPQKDEFRPGRTSEETGAGDAERLLREHLNVPKANAVSASAAAEK